MGRNHADAICERCGKEFSWLIGTAQICSDCVMLILPPGKQHSVPAWKSKKARWSEYARQTFPSKPT